MARRRWARRVARAGAALLVSLATLVGCGTEPPPATPAPLRILLVNDDGWAAPGIVALRTALRRAGHRVVEVAPLRDGGSAGTAMTMRGELQILTIPGEPDLWTVGGTPSDAAMVGLRAVMAAQPPDLVVVGINSERSVGFDVMRSGTVGAAIAASAVGFPAVAVSTEADDPRRPRPSELARPADFVVRLVAALSAQRVPAAPLMPLRTVLNVNYPRGPAAPRGVVVAPTTDAPTADVSYRFGRNPRAYLPRVTALPAAGGDNDATALSSGQVTLTDLSADPDRAEPPPRTAAQLAPRLEP